LAGAVLVLAIVQPFRMGRTAGATSTRRRSPTFPLSAPNRSSHTSCCKNGCELRVHRALRIVKLQCPFESEVRIRRCRKGLRTSESGHWAPCTACAAR
jgi:hypothetical protein